VGGRTGQSELVGRSEKKGSNSAGRRRCPRRTAHPRSRPGLTLPASLLIRPPQPRLVALAMSKQFQFKLVLLGEYTFSRRTIIRCLICTSGESAVGKSRHALAGPPTPPRTMLTHGLSHSAALSCALSRTSSTTTGKAPSEVSMPVSLHRWPADALRSGVSHADCDPR
jgi:hypothetical protein